MASQFPPIVFFGSDNFSLPLLAALQAAGWEIQAVITKPDSRAGRGRQLTAPPTKVWAAERGISVLQPDKLSEAEPKLNHFGVQMGVVASYGKIIPDKVLDLFPLGLINVHPSLLPKYRGPSPIEAAILNGDTETGVSMMRLTPQMDAGPVFAQETMKLNGTETQPQLYDQLAAAGARLLTANLPAITTGELQPTPQDEQKVTVTRLIEKADGQIDWTKPAAQIERQIRAYLTWPGSRTSLFGREVLLTLAHTLPGHDPQLAPGTAEQAAGLIIVQTGNGTLCVDRLKPAGSREMTARQFLAGLRPTR